MKQSLLLLLMLFSALLRADESVLELLKKHDEFAVLEYDKIKSLLWNSTKTALAFCHSQNPTSCYIVDSEHAVNVSHTESANLGKLGLYNRSEYEKVITYSDKWLESQTDMYLVSFKTQAWLSEQRYTVSESTLVKNGTYSIR